MEYTDYDYINESPQGTLRGNNSDSENTTAPTISPTVIPEADEDSTYTQIDKTFIGAFIIFPFVFSSLTGALSGIYIAKEGNDTPKFHIISKAMLFSYSIVSSSLSLYVGSDDKIDTSSHINAVAWMLASVPVAFFSAENYVKKHMTTYLAQKEN